MTLILLVLVVSLATYSCSVSKSSIEGLCVWIEKVLDVSQTLNFEFLWLFLNDLPGMQKEQINLNEIKIACYCVNGACKNKIMA